MRTTSAMPDQARIGTCNISLRDVVNQSKGQARISQRAIKSKVKTNKGQHNNVSRLRAMRQNTVEHHVCDCEFAGIVWEGVFWGGEV